MKLWKWALAVMVAAAAIGLVVGCASESKKAREEARIEARAQELAERIVQKVKEADTATLATAGTVATEKTFDNRFINPPGTLWKSMPVGNSSDFNEAIIFYASGRWVDPIRRTAKDCPNRKISKDCFPNGNWYVDKNLLIAPYYGDFHDTMSYTIESNPETKSLDGPIFLKLHDWWESNEKLTLCEPEAHVGCSGEEKYILESIGIELKELEKLINK